ncbi:MAG: hypothetical protein MUE48_11015 [Desulfobacterales bacterium]|nr:hypothetical protein [Desulfobacterales bacterium]
MNDFAAPARAYPPQVPAVDDGQHGFEALDLLLRECHAVLNGDAAIERLDALDEAFGDGPAVVKEPVKAIEGNRAIRWAACHVAARSMPNQSRVGRAMPCGPGPEKG